jgi:hypothetical protein
MFCKEILVRRWIGAVALAFTLMFSGSSVIHSAAAQAQVQKLQKPRASKATDLSARHRTRHYVDRRSDRRPVYDDRPEYYRPYPYVLPAPFPLGLGFGPRW